MQDTKLAGIFSQMVVFALFVLSLVCSAWSVWRRVESAHVFYENVGDPDTSCLSKCLKVLSLGRISHTVPTIVHGKAVLGMYFLVYKKNITENAAASRVRTP